MMSCRAGAGEVSSKSLASHSRTLFLLFRSLPTVALAAHNGTARFRSTTGSGHTIRLVITLPFPPLHLFRPVCLSTSILPHCAVILEPFKALPYTVYTNHHLLDFTCTPLHHPSHSPCRWLFVMLPCNDSIIQRTRTHLFLHYLQPSHSHSYPTQLTPIHIHICITTLPFYLVLYLICLSLKYTRSIKCHRTISFFRIRWPRFSQK